MNMLYTYKAKVTRVIDGDTFVCDLDLGFNMWIKGLKIRLLNYNAPETRGKEKLLGVMAKAILKDLINNKEIIIRTTKSDAFGRYLGEVWLQDDTNLVEKLVSDGYGVNWDGKGKRPAFDTQKNYPIKTI